MQPSDRLAELRERIDEAVARYEQSRSELRSLGDSIEPGDLLLLGRVSLDCVVVLPHPDDPRLWYLVPADQNPMVGAADVEVPETARSGPMTLRCGRGTWVQEDVLDPENRIGRIELKYVELAHDKLLRIVTGDLTPSRRQQELDWDPDYQDWLDQVARSVEALEAELATAGDRRPTEVSHGEFRPDWSSGLQRRPVSQFELAARSPGGLLDTEKSPPGLIIDRELPGELLALSYPDGIILQYFRVDDEDAPRICWLDTDGNEVQAEWQETPDGTLICFERLPWRDRTIVVEVAGRAVTIRR